MIRVTYAALLFLTGFAFYYQITSQYRLSPLAVLGQGSELFRNVVLVQFLGIYLFMPAMTCGVITAEKERNSLGLLFLTRLGPWTILLEKYLARVIPMFMFLLLSLPLLVIAYTLGGITQPYLWSGIWFLTITVFQIGALALFCSCFFRTTVASFVATYLLTAVMIFGVSVVVSIFKIPLEDWMDDLARFVGWKELVGWMHWVRYPFAAPQVFLAGQGRTFIQSICVSVPILLSTGVLLCAARYCFVRRAFFDSV